MANSNLFKSDLFEIHNVIQSSMIVYPKEILIATLRDFFSKDSYYHYSTDKFGFANTTDHTNLPLGADLPSRHPDSTAQPSDLLSTRVFIGENYRFNGLFYPAILVKHSGTKYVPISINREKESIKYEDIVYEDGYGHSTVVSRPSAYITAGAWEGSITIDVLSRSLRARDELTELIMILLSEIAVDYLYQVGLIVKPPHAGAPSETEDRNDKLFRQSITIEIRSEYRREVPINSIINAIMFAVSFQNSEDPNSVESGNLTINTEVNLLDSLINI